MVAFAIVSVIALLAYAFKGIGKFAVVMLPWHFTGATTGPFQRREHVRDHPSWRSRLFYSIKGGMISVVVTEMTQFTILAVSSIAVGVVAVWKVSPDMIRHFGSRRLDESLLRLEAGPRLDGDTRLGQRLDPAATEMSSSWS
jgi:SSS family solute:Na+ symporter